MSLIHDSRPDDQQLVRYLLGLLPEEETERLDETTLVDDEAAWRLRIVEDDLVNGYVRGTLGRETLERFELHYLASPRRRENVRFAASVLRAVDRAGAGGNQRASSAPAAVGQPQPDPGSEPTVSHQMAPHSTARAGGLAWHRDGRAAPFAMPGPGASNAHVPARWGEDDREHREHSKDEQGSQSGPQRDTGLGVGPGWMPGRMPPGFHHVLSRFRPFAVAALLLLVSGTLLFEVVRVRNGGNLARNESVGSDCRSEELERPVTNQPADRSATREPAIVSESETEADRVASAAPGTGPAQEMATVALVLLPQTRAIGPVPTLVTPQSTDRVRFELRVESTHFPRYQIGLKDPATNQIVWRSGWVTATSSGAQPTVSVVVPVRLLKPQHYSLDLAGRAATGSTEVVGSYGFQIVPR